MRHEPTLRAASPSRATRRSRVASSPALAFWGSIAVSKRPNAPSRYRSTSSTHIHRRRRRSATSTVTQLPPKRIKNQVSRIGHPNEILGQRGDGWASIR